jgi:hypothetical protein
MFNNYFFFSTFSVSDISKDASTINAQDQDNGSHDEEQLHMYESDVEKHFKSGKSIFGIYIFLVTSFNSIILYTSRQ